MLTDWVLIGRLARELEGRLRGARLQDVGLLDDGRIALLFRRGGERSVMAIDLFVSPPMVTIEDAELGIREEPGFLRALARALQGMSLEAVASRRFDRLLRLQFSSRSRFGVGDRLDLYLELVPRFGNIVLVKNESIVAARKEFGPAENALRTIQTGGAYELPPLPARPVTIVADLPEPSRDDALEPLHVYRRDGKLAQAYVVPLAGFEADEHALLPSLLQTFAELRAEQTARADNERAQRRRRALAKRLAERETKLQRELSRLLEKRRAVGGRDDLREQGDLIFATLHTLDEAAREEAKERAAALFSEYKKLGNSLPHLATRERALNSALGIIETLRWESERAGDEDLADVESAVEELGRRRGATAPAAGRKRKRRTLELRTSSGSRILVGRSPVENADLTFRIARPNDLWFHAQGIPGAHVILSRDDRTRTPDEDLQTAASLAAFYSKAREAASVTVDYTQRKHVRKQRDAPPGLVWYTHAKSIVTQPQPLDIAPER